MFNPFKIARRIRAHSLECDAYALDQRAREYTLTAKRRRYDAMTYSTGTASPTWAYAAQLDDVANKLSRIANGRRRMAAVLRSAR